MMRYYDGDETLYGDRDFPEEDPEFEPPIPPVKSKWSSKPLPKRISDRLGKTMVSRIDPKSFTIESVKPEDINTSHENPFRCPDCNGVLKKKSRKRTCVNCGLITEGIKW